MNGINPSFDRIFNDKKSIEVSKELQLLIVRHGTYIEKTIRFFITVFKVILPTIIVLAQKSTNKVTVSVVCRLILSVAPEGNLEWGG